MCAQSRFTVGLLGLTAMLVMQGGGGSAGASTPSPEPVLESSIVSADAVLWAQRELRAKGLYGGPVDGTLNPEMKDALRNYQNANGLRQTAILDVETFRSLMSRTLE